MLTIGYATCARSKGGTLDKVELGNVFEMIGSVLKQDELDSVMSDISNTGDGEVRKLPYNSLAAPSTAEFIR